MKRNWAAAGIALAACAGFAFGDGARTIYPYPMDPAEHPDYLRHHVKAPTDAVFGNKMQFMALRDLSGPDYKERIDRWVDQDRLGNILWVSYPLIFQKNLGEVAAEIRRRGLYLFDLWGYRPGLGANPDPFTGRQSHEYIIPDGALDLLQRELGDRWLGMDNGEQDGRYIGHYAPFKYPLGNDRTRQYFNFQRHFQRLGDDQGNKLATLVSLSYGHYFLKEGIYTLIGAETAQGLPNSQIYYSFIRGAGKQYGVRWFGNASVWNRWGWKTYEPRQCRYDEADYGAGNPLKGTSLSLLKRLLYTHLFYNCAAAGLEGSMRTGAVLSPIGKIQQAAVKWSEEHGDPGTMYTPLAFLTDFFAGWTFPRHLYSAEPYKVWGALPYGPSDYLTDNLLDIVYPGYQDSSYYHDERGFIAPTPYGDIADFLLSDAPLWLLRQYPMLVVAGRLRPGLEIKEKLEGYAAAGGRLVVTAGSVEGMPGGLAGVSVKGRRSMDAAVSWRGRELRESGPFTLAELALPAGAEAVQTCGGIPAIAEFPYGRGRVSVIASPFALPDRPQCALPVRIREDRPLDRPFPMLRHARAYLESLFAGLPLFETDPALSLVTCVKNENEYSVLLTNSGWEARPFSLRSKIGPVASIREMPIDEYERCAVGYAPRTVTAPAGENAPGRIAGGGTRAFSVTVRAPAVRTAEKVPAEPNPSGRALTLRDITCLKEEILARPTFFQHFDRAAVDWRYLERRDPETLAAEAGWLGRQKLKISVNLSSGLNLYPDLRIADNHRPAHRESIRRILRILDKMALIGADELILSSQPFCYISRKEFDRSAVETFRLIAGRAAGKGIRLLYSPVRGRTWSSAADAARIVREVARPNFLLAPSAALLLADPANLDANLEVLRRQGAAALLMAAPRFDINGRIWDLNAPLAACGDPAALDKIRKAFPGAPLILDGLYAGPDEEYRDAQIANREP